MASSPLDPIYALATPPAASAIAVIRVSGPGSLALLAPLLRGRAGPGTMDGHTLRRFSFWDDAEKVDEVLLAVYRAPRSYTGEEGAEIFCHGSLPLLQRACAALDRAGFRAAGPGEFTQRAFLNGRIDLTRAEAVNEIVRARTDRARALALDRLGGAIEARVREARSLLLDLKAELELRIDTPDDAPDDDGRLSLESLEAASALLAALARTFRHGRIFQEGATVAIVGATNAGKSSLFNALLRQDRAIVSPVHGTTRDWLEGAVSLDGIPVRLLDTAGLRSSPDPLESEGMRRTRELAAAADAVVYVVDGTVGIGPADDTTGPGERPLVRAWNKVDLPGCLPVPTGYVPLSAARGDGVEELSAALSSVLLGGAGPEAGATLVDSERQRDLLLRACGALDRLREEQARGVSADLLSVDLADALAALGELTGEISSAEVLDRMFSRFCVGK